MEFTHFSFVTGAWIISGGTATGVMRMVGEAIRDYSLTRGSSAQEVVTLGVAPWGIIDNKEDLTDTDVNSCFVFLCHLC